MLKKTGVNKGSQGKSHVVKTALRELTKCTELQNKWMTDKGQILELRGITIKATLIVNLAGKLTRPPSPGFGTAGPSMVGEPPILKSPFFVDFLHQIPLLFMAVNF
jgi:hypothetical protein